MRVALSINQNSYDESKKRAFHNKSLHLSSKKISKVLFFLFRKETISLMLWNLQTRETHPMKSFIFIYIYIYIRDNFIIFEIYKKDVLSIMLTKDLPNL